MTPREQPIALLAISKFDDADFVVPVVAALDSRGLDVHVVELGRIGRASGTVERALSTVSEELAERRLRKEVVELRPDVALAFQPALCSALCRIRKSQGGRFPVIASVPDLAPGDDWANCGAERFVAVDNAAAAAVQEAGNLASDIAVGGAIVPAMHADAAFRSAGELRDNFGISSERVVLLSVAGLAPESAAQVALQLSLVDSNYSVTFLFDAGEDRDVAQVLRAQVPVLGIRAKLFGATSNVGMLWRCADVVVVPAHAPRIHQAMSFGARVVVLGPDGDDEQALADAVVERGRAELASTTLLLSGALESALAAKEARKKASANARLLADGAGNLAAAALALAKQGEQILAEREASASEERRSRVGAAARSAARAKASHERMAQKPGELEDLGSLDDAWMGGAPLADESDAPSLHELDSLAAELSSREKQLNRQVGESHMLAKEWKERAAAARERAEYSLVAAADKEAEKQSARMHTLLAELAQLSEEKRQLGEARKQAKRARKSSSNSASKSSTSTASASSKRTKARSSGRRRGTVDDELADLKRRGDGSAPSTPRPSSRSRRSGNPSVDAELAALKRKMDNKKRGGKK